MSIPPPPASGAREAAASSAAFLERKKNEIVNAMLIKIKPFVGSSGSIQPDVDFDRLGKVMEEENEFLGRTLLLTILLSSTAEPSKGDDETKAIVFLLCDRITRSASILTVLQKWLTEASKAGEPDCHLSLKILQLLGRLHLSVDHLVQYKYGKLVKKILGREDCVNAETKQKAQDLYDRWSNLAKVDDSSRRSSADSQPRKSTSTSESVAVENPGLFGDVPVPKTRAAMILERAAKAQSAPKTVPAASTRYSLTLKHSVLTSDRPMSADDIHKAKKRRQYLQEAVASGQAAPEELEQLGLLLDHLTSPPPPPPPDAHLPPNHINPNMIDLNMDHAQAMERPSEISPRTGRPKKRVSFANEEELVQVHYFDPEEEEQQQTRKSSLSSFKAKKKSADYHHADKQEASYAFNRLREEMESEIEWREPLDITITDENIAPARGEESEEKYVQEQRERQAVSAVYFSPEHVPPSPSEMESTLNERPSREPFNIPSYSAPPQKIVIADPKNPQIDPKVLASFMLAPPPAFPPPPGIPPLIPPPLPGMPRPSTLPPPPFPLPNQGITPGASVFPPFPPPGIPFQGAAAVRPPFPFPMPGVPRPPLAPPGMFPSMPMPVPGQAMPPRPYKVRLCKFYQPGQPASCRFGANCSFVHQD